MTNLKIAVINLQHGVCNTRGYWQYPLTSWKYCLPLGNRLLKTAEGFVEDQQINIALCTEDNSIMSNYEMSDKKRHPLESKVIKRVIDQASIEVNGRKILLIVAHLSLSSALRKKQIIEIIKIINDTDGPVILGGDFNCRDNLPAEIEKHTRLKQAPLKNTYPSWNPKYPLDRIFTSPEFKIKEITAYSSGKLFSDHLPLIVGVVFNDNKKEINP